MRPPVLAEPDELPLLPPLPEVTLFLLELPEELELSFAAGLEVSASFHDQLHV